MDSEKQQLDLTSELYRHVRPCRHMRSRQWRLLPGDAAAHGLQFEAGILSNLHGSADCLAHERRHFDSTLLDIQHHGSSRCQSRLCGSGIVTLGGRLV